jgi:hypothetical protein
MNPPLTSKGRKMSDELESRDHHAITHDDETYIKLADASVTFSLYRKVIAAKDEEITRLRATINQIMTPGDNYKRLNAALATARRDEMEQAAQRLEELHKNHGYDPKTGEVRQLGKLVTCPLTIEHSIGYYRAIAEGVAHIRAAAGEGK